LEAERRPPRGDFGPAMKRRVVGGYVLKRTWRTRGSILTN
jgi:hypothetical protein